MCVLPCLERRPSPGKGDGLWTTERIPAYTVVGVYEGWVVTDVNQEVPSRFKRYTMNANDDGSIRILGDPAWSLLSLVNEPDNGCFANLHLQFVLWPHVGTRRDTLYVAVYVTAHDILPETELLISYGATAGKGQRFFRDGYQPGNPPKSRELPALSIHLEKAFTAFCLSRQLSPTAVACTWGAVEEDEYDDVSSEGLQDLEDAMSDMNTKACEAAANMRREIALRAE